MYLSHLLIDIGEHPDRPRPARRWLQNIYHVHQRLSMAFPAPGQREKDPEFLLPFDPAGFDRTPFLFRIAYAQSGDTRRPVILVQSESAPDWDYAFHNAPFLAAQPQVKPYTPTFSEGDLYRFRIRINLSKKSKKSADGSDLSTPGVGVDAAGRPKSQSKRVALTWEASKDPESVISEWFTWKAARQGFAPDTVRLVHLGRVTGTKASRRLTFQSALLEGALAVACPAAFLAAVQRGIGSAKAFGFGLLSVAPVPRGG